MVVGETKQGTIQKFTGQDGNQGSRNYAYPAIKQLLTNEIDRDNCQGAQDGGEIGTDNIYGVLGWRTQANKPGNASHKPVKERRPGHCSAIGVEGIRVEENAMREMLEQIIHQSHVIPGISASEPD